MRTIMSLIIMLGAASFLLPAPGVQLESIGVSGTAIAQEAWKAEFDDICSKTDNSDALTSEEIKVLIDRCDKLKVRIEKLDETQKKVYLKRLQMCRDLFAFMLETKENK
jgi:hypothetical protein